MDWKREAMIHIEMEIERKIGSGMEKRDAVYAVKRELAKIKKPLEADGHYRMAIDAVQKDMGCTLDKLANMTEEFDLDLETDLGFTETDIDFMFEGDDRFSKLFETVEGEKMRGTLEDIKAARKKLREGAKVMDNIDWYTVIVHENEEARKAFMREISMPVFEKYITEDQVRRLTRHG